MPTIVLWEDPAEAIQVIHLSGAVIVQTSIVASVSVTIRPSPSETSRANSGVLGCAVCRQLQFRAHLILRPSDSSYDQCEMPKCVTKSFVAFVSLKSSDDRFCALESRSGRNCRSRSLGERWTHRNS
jgi:hypothetical protein